MKMKENKLVKILLVDDLPENLFALELILIDKNYSFVRANSGNEALKILLREQDFAIILIDVQMPEMDGFETVELIREIETLKHVPIIFLTASMDRSIHIFKGYQTGAVDYMVKPLIPEILKAKVAVFVDLFLKTNELIIQNEENEKQAEELKIANKELLAFAYISSHDMQEPLRKIQIFASIIIKEEIETLTDNGKNYLHRIQSSAERMQMLIHDLLAFSLLNTKDRKFEKTELSAILEDIKAELKDTIKEKNATIEAAELCCASIIPFQFRQLMYNLISNALKYSQEDLPPHITIKSRIVKESLLNIEKLTSEKNYCHIIVKDNGIGFEPQYAERIFGVFQKLHDKDTYAGSGIGLAIVKKIVENHNGIITATSELNEGATFDIYIPAD